MKYVRNYVCVLIAALGLAFAPYGLADTPNKHFTLSMGIGVIDNTQGNSTVVATIDNDNPSGSSAQFSSFTLTLTSVSGITIKSADVDSRFGGTVSVSADQLSVSVTGFSPVKATQTYELTIHVAGCGDRNSWKATVWSGNNLSGGSYIDDSDPANGVTNVPCGILACGNTVGGITVKDLIDTTVLNPVDGQPRSRRGPVNEDGSCTDAVNYYVSEFATDSPSNTYLHFRWQDNQRGAAFFYIPEKPIGSNPLFGWKAQGDDPSTATPIFVAAQACDQGKADFPGSYGKVISDGAGRTIKVDTTTHVYTPPTPPFRIAIGPKPMEYMMVTKISGQTWTVTRRAGAIAHPVGATVMSTPLPALQTLTCFSSNGTQLPSCPTGTYVLGEPARMCSVQIDSTHTGIFDIGDGYVGLR